MRKIVSRLTNMRTWARECKHLLHKNYNLGKIRRDSYCKTDIWPFM